ncbi:DNA mismatch repair endonuclease MutH [uncultured Shewanella sp.]|uniref:DNA mismatch repair endonuclease MutH n=1 Tax=uncultured Shewanella sp. TaxID=173975 RepID=UPI0026108DA8|nr:DNA mismatch repair endonuclease MutH [uncultured Shewanella sp.]
MKTIPQPPQSLSELMKRANAMAGLSLGLLAHSHNITVPKNLKRDKGWVGQLIEHELGAIAGSKPEPDFANLGIELKTIPINHQGKPIETTYVTVAPLQNIQGLTWENSVVYHKLRQVLWIPIQGERHIPINDRQIGTPILWRPSDIEMQQLKQDWEEIMELITLGQIDSITARHGEVLQLRPKAANSKILTQCIGKEGGLALTNPRGFYLKIAFTHQILSQLI